MIPKEQRIEYYWDVSTSSNTLKKECNYWIDKGYVIHQIILEGGTKNKSCYLLLYKY